MKANKSAVRTFRFWLLVSILANAAVGVIEPGEENPFIAPLVHSLYPLAFACAENLLVKVKLINKAAETLRLVLGFVIAGVAFVGSAANLAHLAELGKADIGYMKWTLPIIIDLLIAKSMLSTVFPSVDENPIETAPMPWVQGKTKVEKKKPEAKIKSLPKEGREKKISEILQANPKETAAVIAETLDCSVKTVTRTMAWKERG